jgi:putative ABC transport system permease protein
MALDLLADFRVAARGLLRSKGFAAAGILTLALGIGATTTIFSVVYGVLLRPLPYRDADRLVVIQGEKNFSTGPRMMNYSAAELEDFTASVRTFSSIALTAATGFTMRGNDGPEPIPGANVSGTFFDTMGTPPLIGRLLGDEAEPNVVISERMWRRRFGGRADVVGQTVVLADSGNTDRTYTIVGVLPLQFQYPHARTDMWRPLKYLRALNEGNINNPNAGGFFFIGRVRDGVAMADVERDAAQANDVLKPHFNAGRSDMRAKVVSLAEWVTGTIGPALWILMGAVTVVMLVACANVANLILARQSSRQREMSMRLALGAPRGRLVAYLLAESALIAVAGGVTGAGIAVGAIRLLQWMRPAMLPRIDAIEVDLPVLLFAIAGAIVASLAAGLGPAIMATRADLLLAMRAAARNVIGASGRVRSALVIAEIAVSIVLLVGATLLTRSLAELIDTDLGVNTENVMTAQLDLGLGRILPPERQYEIARSLRERIAQLPAVREVGYGSGLPPNSEYFRMSFVLNNRDNTATENHIITTVPSSPDYFSVLQIPLLRGRFFTDADVAQAPPVGIINRVAARQFFGNDDPIGRTIPFNKTSITIIGVVENVKYTGIANEGEGVLYRPFAQQPMRVLVLVAKTTGDPAAIAADLRSVIKSYDPDIGFGAVQPLTTWISDAVAQPRFRTVTLSSIALITLVLAMVGLYGVIAYSTSQRTAEIGLRVAVGAQRADVVRLVLAEGARLAVFGIVIGVAGAYWATRLLSSFLYGVTATDLSAFAGSSIALLAVALLATYLPARRAARIDPMTALRTE